MIAVNYSGRDDFGHPPIASPRRCRPSLDWERSGWHRDGPTPATSGRL